MIIFSNFGEDSEFVFVRFLRLGIVTKKLLPVDALSCLDFPGRFADDLVHERGAIVMVSADYSNERMSSSALAKRSEVLRGRCALSMTV